MRRTAFGKPVYRAAEGDTIDDVKRYLDALHGVTEIEGVIEWMDEDEPNAGLSIDFNEKVNGNTLAYWYDIDSFEQAEAICKGVGAEIYDARE